MINSGPKNSLLTYLIIDNLRLYRFYIGLSLKLFLPVKEQKEGILAIIFKKEILPV